MIRVLWNRVVSLAVVVPLLLLSVASQTSRVSYLGFDRNEYPGDGNLKTLRETFSYAGYWLNNPPGASANEWVGHRAAVESAGFGFLVLFNGRLYAELKTVANAKRLGQADAQAAIAGGRREGFPAATIIFLDQEQGGRMLPEQKAYIYAWVDGVIAAGFRAGIYCSGIPAKDDGNVVTAEDIREHSGDVSSVAGKSARSTQPATQPAARPAALPAAQARDVTYWVINDACPPAPGCAFSSRPPSPAESGVRFAEVWQFAQSPRRKDVAGRCTNYSRDGNCYPPGGSAARGLAMDLNAATSPDPSRGRTR
jgi:hypothetical protein